MRVSFAYRVYRRAFGSPLVTAHGAWAVREGILLRLEGEGGGVGFGEIAPVPWFGTEDLGDALAFCERAGATPDLEELERIDIGLPCCRFGFGSAAQELAAVDAVRDARPVKVAALLMVGGGALSDLERLWDAGFETFKWKIGVSEPEVELKILGELLKSLPDRAKLRLDANGSFDESRARKWLGALEGCEAVEYLEQPLAADAVEEMQRLSEEFETPIALDESVARLPELKQVVDEGWTGPLVVKPTIVGAPCDLVEWARMVDNSIVISSVFETGVGFGRLLKLAADLGDPGVSHGLGTVGAFDDALNTCSLLPVIEADTRGAEEPERIWKNLAS